MSPLTLRRSERPSVSIVMVTYGGWPLARRALQAVRDHTGVPHEVVVVDNASPDGTAERIRSEVRGATVVLNQRNLGFGPAVNQGADLSRGHYLLLLNSDALVRPGWLEPLIENLERDPRAGAAVSRLLNDDGTVQEAGSIVWSDGSTLAVGAGASPTDPRYRFPRYTDYGSAACMLLRRGEFLAVGGFHPGYVPAYCEDVDLALKLASRGLLTAYVPRSEAVHVRFGSTDEGRAARLIEENRHVLRARWPRELASRIPPADPDHPHRLISARDVHHPERLLLVGDAVRPSFTAELARRYPEARITAWARGEEPDDVAVDRLSAMGIEVASAPEAEGWLRERLFHYSAVVVSGAAVLRDLASALRRTQPQAGLVLEVHGGPPAGDLVRAADVILCRTESDREAVLRADPSAEVVAVGGSDPLEALIPPLERFGMVAERPSADTVPVTP